ncbi:hypothetical protein [Amycolatopsis aidingensis]|nr:hypothetical protein [Amycolatopsis aidingensis]
MNEETPRGDELLRVRTALANPQRLRIVAWSPACWKPPGTE